MRGGGWRHENNYNVNMMASLDDTFGSEHYNNQKFPTGHREDGIGAEDDTGEDGNVRIGPGGRHGPIRVTRRNKIASGVSPPSGRHPLL